MEQETIDEKPAGGNSRPTICSATVALAMMAFIKRLDPHASCFRGCCSAEIDGTIISANLRNEFDSIRSVYQSAVDKVERRGFFITKG